MWTDEKIKTWVSEHHGGHEWQAFEGEQLLTDASREAFVGTMIEQLVDEWKTSFKYLPNVCEPGMACRAEVNRVLIGDLELKWDHMLVSIDTKIRQTELRVREELVEFYQRAYECAPGCHCDNIMIEYDQVIIWQNDLSTRIVEYTTNLNGLILNEQQIIESCPAYIYDADGNAFFDYSGASTSTTTTTTTTSSTTEESSGETTESVIVGGDDFSLGDLDEDVTTETTTESSSESHITYNGEEITMEQFEAIQAQEAADAAAAAAAGSSSTSTTSSSSSASYNVNGVDMTQAEYDAYMAGQTGTTTSSSSSSATYNVNGVDMTEAEYNEYMANQEGFVSE